MEYIIFLFCFASFSALQIPQSPVFKFYEHDISVYQYIGKMMLEGQIPYKDIFDHKGPLVYLWHMFAYALHPLYGIYYIESIWFFFSLYLSFKTIAKFISQLTALLLVCAIYSTIHVLDTIGNTESLALFFITYIIKLFVDSIQQNKLPVKVSVSVGLCCSALLLIKPLYLCIPGVLVASLLIYFLKQKRHHVVWQFILYGSLALTLPVLLVIYIFYRLDALADLWECYIIFNIDYAKNFHNMTDITSTAVFFLQETTLLLPTFIGILWVIVKKRSFTPSERYIIYTLLITYTLSFISIILPQNAFPHYTLILYPLLPPILSLYSTPFKQKEDTLQAIFFVFLLINLHNFYIYLQHNNYSSKTRQRLYVASIINHILPP